MAAKTLDAHGFAAGTSVSAYPAENLVNGGPPSGTAVDTATVAAVTEELTFEGLTEGRRYVAYAGGRAVHFFMEPGSVDQLKPIRAQEAQDLRDAVRVVSEAALNAADPAYDGDFQVMLDALPADGGHIIVPHRDGGWTIEENVSVADKQDIHIQFLGGAYLDCRVASGDILTVLRCHRPIIERPRFRLRAGAPSAFLVLDGGVSGGSLDAEIRKPMIWSDINIPANCDCIVVQNDAYWAEIHQPKIRKDSAGLTGTFRRGVAFLSDSNAGQVLGGSVNHCTDGVYNENCNSTVVDRTAFENCTDAVELAELSQGAVVLVARGESLTNVVNISQTTVTNFGMEIQIGFLRVNMASAVTTLINNPNGVPFTRMSGTKLELRSPGQSTHQNVKVYAQASDQQGEEDVMEVRARPVSGGGLVWSNDQRGAVSLAGVAAASVPNNAFFRDSADGKLKWKDNSGVVNATY